MTVITLSARPNNDLERLHVEQSLHVDNGAYVRLDDERAHLTHAETRQLRDALNNILGENEPAPIKVGDRVTVIREESDITSALDGRSGVVESLDPGDTYPYLVLVDGEEYSIWCHFVRREIEPTPEPAEGAAESAPVPTVDRRTEAAAKAREILSASGGPFGIRPATDPEPVIRLAEWLLGDAA
ncbi:hypothetical protein [Streptomyces sp. CB03911]|uniref:hypothetical protein n=1 Tax=Streptomyces sp. CB03911 TaxID=1804758 RepID=UPI00093C0F05|nr:hypothetical protein [Streptomyces sp. CB03911]OKI19265.1 hypothetical protein A6A07_07125 [Streptomyces sp. CB03911]